ncbi:TetR/AcrR family transcriptional regulator [Brevibacterium ravenspurgense]|uniref:TetR/AcrR family transcriptional regulator n=1 Tax=Brevibacterium ravenspurgense TaxID=479117 RepID=UPI001EF2EF47|nr:TetR/AcrR family transcriptional regulator [Brevibacterium ravenspurgense]MCG7301376.1 TetR/AcrR family transcriptional regulator [Brevibacterium ravenspurgense]
MTDSAGPKQERSRATHRRLLESTISALAELGWESATTTEIAQRSGVSRGSLQHHFPTREELIVAALHHVFEERTAQLREMSRQAPENDPFGYVAEMLLELYTGDLFLASLQAWTASPSNPKLYELIVPLETSFGREAFTLAVELLHADTSDETTFRTVQLTLDLARGLGLANVLTDDAERRQKIIAAWTQTLRGIKTTKPFATAEAASD